MRLADHDRVMGTMDQNLCIQQVNLCRRRQGEHAKLIGMPSQYIQCALANRACGPQYRDELLLHAGSQATNIMATGSTGNNASMRSKTPP